jgi:hypothetical protein
MLTLSFNGQEKTISVADRAPIVGDGSGLEARRELFVPAWRGWGFVDRNRRRRRQRCHAADVGASKRRTRRGVTVTYRRPLSLS